METLQIAGVSANPGTSVRGSIPVMELADGSPVNLPLLLINGVRPGPRVYLGAGIHGDEVSGIALLAQAMQEVDPAQLSGSIVCVPVQQPLAFQADHRLPLTQLLKSPLDQMPADAWTCFPGDAGGNSTQILAAMLFELIRQCNLALDIHTPTRGGRYVPIAILPHPDLGQASRRAEEIAHGLGCGWIMRGTRGMYVADGILCVEATKAGVPCLTFEIGEGGRLEPQVVTTGKRCILNLLRSLEMIPGEPQRPAETHLMRDFVGLRARHGGLLVTETELGQPVRKGDTICRILNLFGDEVERITAPEDGLFVRATTLSTVSQGERVATLGLV